MISNKIVQWNCVQMSRDIPHKTVDYVGSDIEEIVHSLALTVSNFLVDYLAVSATSQRNHKFVQWKNITNGYKLHVTNMQENVTAN